MTLPNDIAFKDPPVTCMFLVDHRFLQAGHIFIPGRWHIDSAGFAFVETGAEYGMHMKSRVRVGYKCMIESLREKTTTPGFWEKNNAAGGSTSFFWLMIFLASYILPQQKPCGWGFVLTYWAFLFMTLPYTHKCPRALV